jgi:hypothetical protein
MTNPKTDHIIKKHTSTNDPAPRSDNAAATPESNITASATMVEACDRLAQRLDEVASLFREQIQASHQTRESAAPGAGVRETPASQAVDADVTERIPLADQAPRRPQAARPEIQPGQDAGSRALDETGDGSAASPGDEGASAAVQNAHRLVDTLSRSRDGWQEQAAGLQEALEAIMDFLEGQAATAPKVDVAEIMSRLRNLEEEQQSLQSQFSTNRWGP